MRIKKHIAVFKSQTNSFKQCIVISSTPKYSYIWEPFFKMLYKYWKTPPDIYFISSGKCSFLNEKYDINVYETASDLGFLGGYLHVLNDIKSMYSTFICMQDDFIIQKNVNTELLSLYRDILEDTTIGCIRLMPCPEPKGNIHKFNTVTLKEVVKNDDYSFSFQSCMWNIEFFIRLCTECKDMNTWLIEPYLSNKLTKTNKLLLGYIRESSHRDAVLQSPVPYRPTAIVRGKLQDWAKQLLQENDIRIN